MSDNRLQPIVTMANQIAINLAYGKEQQQCIIEIANHIQRFWAPSMRKQLFEAIDSGEFEIEQLVKEAASQITC